MDICCLLPKAFNRKKKLKHSDQRVIDGSMLYYRPTTQIITMGLGGVSYFLCTYDECFHPHCNPVDSGKSMEMYEVCQEFALLSAKKMDLKNPECYCMFSKYLLQVLLSFPSCQPHNASNGAHPSQNYCEICFEMAIFWCCLCWSYETL